MDDIFSAMFKILSPQYTTKTMFSREEQKYYIKLSDKKDNHTLVKVSMQDMMKYSLEDICQHVIRLHEKYVYEKENPSCLKE